MVEELSCHSPYHEKYIKKHNLYRTRRNSYPLAYLIEVLYLLIIYFLFCHNHGC